VLSANVTLPDVAGATTVHVSSHADMSAAIAAHTPDATAVVMAAAIADFAPPAQGTKVKKSASEAPTLTMTRTSDILAGLAASRIGTKPMLIGFAAETASNPQELRDLAASKLASKGCDAIVANDVSGSAVFGEDHASVVMLTRDGEEVVVANSSKLDIGHDICSLIARLSS
jgi:phosphopantothenoylcysteine decarboxylase/phosphopantothenate--cysteine ligase